MHHFITCMQMPDIAGAIERMCDLRCQLKNRIGRVRSDVKYLVNRLAHHGTARNEWSDIVNMRERSCLLAVSEHAHRLALENLVHENPDHVAIRVRDILALSIHVVRSKDDVVKTKHV